MSFVINPRKDLTRQVRRIAIRQLDRMEKEFGVRGEAAHQAVHDARKRIKRLRGLYRLIRAGAGDFVRLEDQRLRDIAQSLSAVRDATALVETADKLAARFTDAKDVDLLSRLRVALVERRDRIARDEIDFDAHLEAAASACEAAKESLGTVKLPTSRSGARDLLVGSLKRSYGRVRSGFAKARDSGAAEDWHDLRKLVKQHMMQVKLLQMARPKAMKKRASALDRLGELLGDDHDLAALVALFDEIPVLSAPDRSRICQLAEIRTGELRGRAAKAMNKLFSERPGKFSCRIDAAWRAAQKKR